MPRLKKVTRAELTVERRRRGKGYSYHDCDGNRVDDPAFLARARALGIPPAWKSVRIALAQNAHIQCCGIDDAGRVQYIYHADWEKKRSLKKHTRLTLLTLALPRVRRRIARDLSAEEGSQALALAIGVALIDRTAMRVGRERYLEASGTRGAGTLYARDVTVDGSEICTSFTAKGGKAARYCFEDARLAAAISRIKTLPGKRLLVYRDDAGKVRPIKTESLNAYLRQIAGVDVSAKDFRTLHASAMAAEALAALEPGGSESARKRQIASVARQVSEFLQNTPMICRKSYIAPCLFTLFDKGRLADLWSADASGPSGLKQRERRLGAVLAAIA
ncbi:DNA topoisomerase IB [Arsenicitalea aurantiaca]|uniref:DNA topoisomerase IB n=1 Tax=Arsenicitalea aurantiaca TaxID=1783274 RepID=A0A433XLH5_9HYPH|nr:DNA topoisomerase IB [Arsenicitalea aurantiaca]RUT34937.1 DNA topoisomerase IB [Arsenicitalea aurantiaca]